MKKPLYITTQPILNAFAERKKRPQASHFGPAELGLVRKNSAPAVRSPILQVLLDLGGSDVALEQLQQPVGRRREAEAAPERHL